MSQMSCAAAVLCALQEEGVDTVFGYPGGTILPIYDALCDSPIRHILTRHEQGAIHAAEGYAKSTGRVGVVLATSGPGAMNLVTGLTDAMMDSVPIVAITGQVARVLIGRDAFQEADVVGVTMPVTKHNYMVADPGDLLRIIKEAFHIARTGRPGPVLVDIPKDVANSMIEYRYPTEIRLPGYRPNLQGHLGQVQKAVEAMKQHPRAVLMCGGGVVAADGASVAFRKLAEKLQVPVVETLQGLGGFPGEHPLSFGLIGMHGTFAANRAVHQCDLLIAVGLRFDDRVTGVAAKFAPKAAVIHVDVDPAEISKNVPSHIPIVGDARVVLEQILTVVGDWRREPGGEWLDQVLNWQAQHPLWGEKPKRLKELAAEHGFVDDPNIIRPQQLLQAVHDLWGTDCIVTVDVGQHQMWAAHYLLREKPRTFLSSSGLGTMGFGLPAGIGAAIAHPDKQVICVSGDGSIQMCIQELGTVAAEEIKNLKVILVNNGYLGMVRQWQQMFFAERYQQVDLRRGMPSFETLCAAYGLKGIQVKTMDQLHDALRLAKEYDGFVFVDVRVAEEENVFPIVPPGAANAEAILKHGD